MTRRRLPRLVPVGLLVAAFILLQAGPALADHLAVDVSAPDSAAPGERFEIRASVRLLESGDPVEGVEILFYSDARFAGVAGEIELGRSVTDAAGVAVFPLDLAVSGTHAIRVEAIAGPEIQPESVSIPVTVGGQLVRSEAGVDIPGFGGWIVAAVIALVWAIMLLSVVRVVRVARAGPAQRRFGLAEGILVVSTLLAVGLTVLLLRGPETHSNLNPEGYQRTVVAYTEADYLYPGPGLAGDVTAEQSVAYGRAIYTSRGCAGCHGLEAEGAATAASPAFASREWLGQVVRTGLPGGMPSYTELDLAEEDLDAIYVFLFAARAALEEEGAGPDQQATTTTSTTLAGAEPTTTTVAAATTLPGETTTTAGGTAVAALSFEAEVAPIFREHCAACHGSLGGWDSDSLDAVLSTGDHAPVVIPGDPEGSLLVHKIQGTQTEGLQMPPSGLMSEYEIQVIIDWIAAGAPG